MNKENMVGMLASSKAGHDINKVYVIVAEEEEYFWLADGRCRGVLKPKKKKKKHIQLIKYFSDDVLDECVQQGKNFSDVEIKRVLKSYEKHRRVKDNQTGK